MNHSPLCCVFSIPKDEANHRCMTMEANHCAQAVHRNNRNHLNSKKDIIIQSMFQQKSWNQQKKRINMYEKFNSYPNGVVKQKACSRAYFKMIEMAEYVEDFLSQSQPIRILTLAEAPGGFLQALDVLRKQYSTSKDWEIFDYYCAVTIKPTGNSPDWSPDILGNCKFHLMYTDLMKDDCIHTITNAYIDNTKRFHLVTADCGIDVSDNFHKQEILMYPFLLAQTELMLRTLLPGGCFILKLFETDTYSTKELLYFIGCCFRQVILVKPRTSRPLNSERYIICRNFQIHDIQLALKLANTLCLYRKRENLQKGMLWPTSIPEECLYLIHGYSRICKEITNRHLQLIMKKIGDDVIRLQYDVAHQLCRELNVEPIVIKHPTSEN